VPPILGECPGTTLVLAHPTNYRAADRITFERIVIHVTDGHANAMPVAEMWQEPNHKSSAHFVVGQDGVVLQAVLLRNVAYHAHAANTTSVGIEHCARTPKELGPNDPGLPPSDAQYAASARLVAWLCKAAALPVDQTTIQGHAEIDPVTTHRECPLGAGWDWQRYMQLVRDEHAKLTEPTPFPNA